MRDKVKRPESMHALFLCVIFVGIFIYMYVAHPFLLTDADDWTFASYWRRPLPVLGGFDSVKVFSETLVPMISMLGAYVIYHISHNYQMALAFAYALAGAGIITVYVAFMAGIVKNMCKCSEGLADSVATCFLMLHFLMYKNDWNNNVHLLWSKSMINFFMYTAAVLLCACLVMFFIRQETVEGISISRQIWSGEWGYLKGGVLIFLIYLAIFSNSFSNIVLATYAGVHGLRRFVVVFRNGKGDKKSVLGEWFKDYWLVVVTLVMWVMALVFQLNDPRNKIAREQGMQGDMANTIREFIHNFTSANKMAALLMVIFVALFAFAFLTGRKKDNERSDARLLGAVSFELVFSGALTAVYLIILSGVSSSYYMGRPDVMLGYFFYILAEVSVLLAWAVCDDGANSKLAILLPFLAFVLVLQTINYCKAYADPNNDGLSKEAEIRMSQDLIDQFVEADEAGSTEFDLHVVENPGQSDNWPYPHYSGDCIADTLYRHGIISRPIKATVVIDPEKNKELMVDFSLN